MLYLYRSSDLLIRECARPGWQRRLPKTSGAALARGLVALAACLWLAAAGNVRASPPDIPAVDLGASTLYSAPSFDKQTLTLTLSTEPSIVGALYQPIAPGGTLDDKYSNTREYLGYYDAGSCYKYIDNPLDARAPGYTKADYKRFQKIGSADGPAGWTHKCTESFNTESFSGNFLNWATSSLMDMVRLTLTGGDRYIDTADLTILQRAVLPGDPPYSFTCMWNNEYFPAKKLTRNNGNYLGAIPLSMINGSTGDIYIAQKWDRIYFGTRLSGNCNEAPGLDYTRDYTLGSDYAATTTRSRGPVSEFIATRPPAGAADCALGSFCNFSGIKEVWFGLNAGVDYRWRIVPAANGIDCTPGNFGITGSPPSGVACFVSNERYQGTWTNTNPPERLPTGKFNSDGFFFARVEVCGKDSQGGLTDNREHGDYGGYKFCQRYPSGNYKPTGVIQRHADQMRLAVFGYLLDPAESRHGGVLRAPMKYVGPTTYDIKGVNNSPRGGNPRAEWDTSTGVFYPDPDNVTAASAGKWTTSGVINYLNKFGRTTPGGRTGYYGKYKRYAPLGELHYEALRYLQGKQPSWNAIKNTTAEMADGFFFATRWADPYGDNRDASANYSCLKSTMLVIGDADTSDQPVGKMTDSIIDTFLISYSRSVVQSFERKTGGDYADGGGVSRQIDNPAHYPNPDVPYKEEASQIMGTAYWANTHDIRGSGLSIPLAQRQGLRVKTMVIDANRGGRQNVTGISLRNNQLHMAAKYGGFETDRYNPWGRPYNTQGNPFINEKTGEADDDVWNNARQGFVGSQFEAASYLRIDQGTYMPGVEHRFLAYSPAHWMLGMFDDMFHTRSIPSGIGSSSLSTGSELVSGSMTYTARFRVGDWTGDIGAKPLSSNASNALVLGADRWSAAQRLDAMAAPETNRKIFVSRSNSNLRFGSVAMEFKWDSIDATLKGQLDRPAPGAQRDGKGERRVQFLRGSGAYDQMFRERKSRLGDIINSNIAYSGLPRKRFEGPGYDAFYKKYAVDTPRKTAVFAGANDGMLHAFDADTGDELFAYIPRWLVPKLSALTEPDYTSHHQAYVDGPSVVAEARIGSTDRTAEDWKTVLVSGTGGGGSGVFALDVSDPADFNERRVLWEFTRADDENIGEVVGAPKIVKMKIANANATTGAAAKYRWFAAVASGVNNYIPDRNGRFSSTGGKPALFLLALDKVPGTPWDQGTNYYRVDIPIDQNMIAGRATGVLNFSALYGDQQEMTDVYFGDLHGQVWRLNFADKQPGFDGSGWTLDRLSFFKKADGTAKPLYRARDGDDPDIAQPISAAPTLLVGPRLAGRQTFYVVFGTGKYLEASDNQNTRQQTVYGLFDSGDPDGKTLPSQSQDTAVIEGGRQHLRALSALSGTQTEGEIGTGSADAAFRWGYPQTAPTGIAASCNPCAGWYFNLLQTGERVDQPGRDLGALTVAINSKTPAAAPTANNTECTYSTTPGGGRQYVINANTGTGDYSTSTVGLLGAPLFVSNSAETVVGKKDSAGRRIVVTTHRRLETGQGGVAAAGSNANSRTNKVTTPLVTGKLSWRRIPNYQELRNAHPAAQAGTNR